MQEQFKPTEKKHFLKQWWPGLKLGLGSCHPSCALSRCHIPCFQAVSLIASLVSSHSICHSFQSKEPTKKNDRASPTKKTPPARASATASLSQVTSNEGRITPATNQAADPLPSSSNPAVDARQERKYKDKFTSQVSLLGHLCLVLNNMTWLFYTSRVPW